jgi:hypothetical protein
VFRHDNGQVAVVYKREDGGGYGLIETGATATA